MVEHVCQKCNKTFNHKGAYDRHLSRQKPCVNFAISAKIVAEIAETTKKNTENAAITCSHCCKIYKRKYELQRHLKNGCKKQNNAPNDELLNKIKQLEDKIILLENKSTANNTTNNNNINNGVIQNNNITINQYGKEDMSHLNLQDFKRLFSKCNSCVPFFVELLHFNKDKPENNNIYISNMKSPYLMLYDGTKWKLAEKNAVLDDMYDDKCEILVNKYENLKDHLDETIMNKFSKFLNKYELMKENVIKDIKLVLYNNRKID